MQARLEKVLVKVPEVVFVFSKTDTAEGSHQGHHHFVSRGLVAEVEGDKVRLSANGAVAVQFEEEQDFTPGSGSSRDI